MAVNDNVYLMSQETFDSWQEIIVEDASVHPTPIKYLKLVNSMEVHIDSRLKVGVIEVYDRMTFHALQEDKDFWGTENDIDFDDEED